MGVPRFCSLVHEKLRTSSPSGMKFCHEILETLVLSYGKNPKPLSHLGLNRYQVVTDGQTDGQTELP